MKEREETEEYERGEKEEEKREEYGRKKEEEKKRRRRRMRRKPMICGATSLSSQSSRYLCWGTSFRRLLFRENDFALKS